MRKNLIILFILLASLTITSSGSAADIKLEGISDDIAIVNGEILKVGDSIEGFTVTSIAGRDVVFENAKGKTLKKSLDRNWWEKTCGDIKAMFPKEKKKNDGGILSMLGFKAGAKKRDPEKLTLEEKMKLADQDLNSLKTKTNDLIAKYDNIDITNAKVKKMFREFNKILDEDSKLFNGLKLVCPTSSKMNTVANPQRYSEWSSRYQKKKEKIINDINQKLQSLATKAARKKGK